MDERGSWDPPTGPPSQGPEPVGADGRPLTRRELRERAEARRAAQAEAEEAAAPPPDQPQSDAPPPDAPQPDGSPSDQPLPDEVERTVELPATVPEEPEVDDVRWDAPVPPVGYVPFGGDEGVGPVPPPAPTGPVPPVWGPVSPWSPVPSGPATPHDQDEARGEPADDDDGPPAGEDAQDPGATSAPAPAAPRARPRAGAPAPTPPVPAADGLPTLDDLLATRPAPAAGPAQTGWQATVRRLTGGLVAPGPGAGERRHRDAVARVQRSLDGPRTVVVINPKGGAHKTTATLLMAATFGVHRGGYTLAWDNNETRGTLGWRSTQAQHHNTAVNLLHDLERFADASAARVGDLDNYVRAQGSARFDVLASDEDAASAASIDAFAFRALHRTLSRFYRVMVVDTGNNMRASNWQAAVEAADQVVIVSTVREDTAQSAAWAVDALRATGHADVVSRAVTVLTSPAPRRDDALARRLHEHFGRLTRAVLDVPYDPALVAGGPIDFAALSTASREAWLHVTATVADGL